MPSFCVGKLNNTQILDSTINDKIARFLGLDYGSIRQDLPSDAAGASAVTLSEWKKVRLLLIQLTGKYHSINNLVLRYTRFLVLCHQVVSGRCMKFKLNSNRTTRCEAVCLHQTCKARVCLYIKSKEKVPPDFHYEIMPHNCVTVETVDSSAQGGVEKIASKTKSIFGLIFMLYVSTENTSLKIQISHSIRVQKLLVQDCLEMFTYSFSMSRMMYVPQDREMAIKWFRPIVKAAKKNFIDREDWWSKIESDYTMSRLLKNFIYWIVFEEKSGGVTA